MALHGNGGILLRDANRLFRYDLGLGARGVQDEDGIHEMDRLKYVGHGRRRHAWKYLCFFNLIPYTESLVPLTANKASSQALQ
jgi:hypothetical protein